MSNSVDALFDKSSEEITDYLLQPSQDGRITWQKEDHLKFRTFFEGIHVQIYFVEDHNVTDVELGEGPELGDGTTLTFRNAIPNRLFNFVQSKFDPWKPDLEFIDFVAGQLEAESDLLTPLIAIASFNGDTNRSLADYIQEMRSGTPQGCKLYEALHTNSNNMKRYEASKTWLI